MPWRNTTAYLALSSAVITLWEHHIPIFNLSALKILYLFLKHPVRCNSDKLTRKETPVEDRDRKLCLLYS